MATEVSIGSAILFAQKTNATANVLFGGVIDSPQGTPSDLLFSQNPNTSSANLLFGSDVDVPLSDVIGLQLDGSFNDLAFSALLGAVTSVSITGEFRDLTVSVQLATIAELNLSGSFSDMQGSVFAKYLSDCDRPTVGRVVSRYQAAQTVKCGISAFSIPPVSTLSGISTLVRNADKRAAQVRVSLLSKIRAMRFEIVDSFSDAVCKSKSSTGQWGDRHLIRNGKNILMQTAMRTGAVFKVRNADRLYKRATVSAAWRDAVLLLADRSDRSMDGRPTFGRHSDRYQAARVPPVGISVYTSQKPPVHYVPSTNLVFDWPFSTSANLLFGNDYIAPNAAIIVPVRRAYIVLNNVEMRRIDGNYLLPVTSMSMRIDMDSWSWDFSAAMPLSALNLLQSEGKAPVLIDARINGHSYTLIAERIQRDRQFGKSSITVTGRSKSALLSDPYSPVLSFNNPTDRTAQQLMNDALTFNGISLGWAIDWRIEDWLIPAGTWNFQGNYMSAVKNIADSAGAFVQPDATQQILRVLPRYPYKPWDAAGIHVDYQLPTSVISTESVSWEDKPAYDAVYVSGTTDHGVLGYVKRAGLGGVFPAQMITDPLITDVVAARMRGIAALADTGRISNYSLSLPVLQETGIIAPGAVVQYMDDSPISGVVKGVSVVADNPKIRQTIEVQTYG